MNINLNEFNTLEFNPIPCDNLKDLKKKYPDLFRWDEFQIETDKFDLGVAIKYVLLMYDKRSPLFRLERNIKKRKEIAGALAEFPKHPGSQNKLYPVYQDIMDGKVPEVQRMVVRFIIHQKDLKYSQYARLCETYYQLYAMSMINVLDAGVSPKEFTQTIKDKQAIEEQLTRLSDKIDDLYDDIFMRDDSLEDFVYEDIELKMDEIPIGYPELMAKRNA
jgi:hypothetical protein